MMALSIRIAATSLFVLAAGCTTPSGVGSGQSESGTVGATFTWSGSSNSGTMVANLTDGRVFQGPFFQITQQSQVDYGPLWNGWGPTATWGRGWSGRGWGVGWRGWGPWGPSTETITRYTGEVLANLEGPGGFMRCHFILANPTSGMTGGGSGECQVPSGTVINAQFPRS